MFSLLSFIYRNGKSDCTNGGISATRDTILAHYKAERHGTIDAKGFSKDEAAQLVYLKKVAPDSLVIVEDVCCGSRRLRAIPASLIAEKAWTMYGGNFADSCDSRFFEHPVKIHDRVER